MSCSLDRSLSVGKLQEELESQEDVEGEKNRFLKNPEVSFFLSLMFSSVY